MDEEYSKYRKDDKYIQYFGRKNLTGRNSLPDLGPQGG
jgi:hypothetical protein